MKWPWVARYRLEFAIAQASAEFSRAHSVRLDLANAHARLRESSHEKETLLSQVATLTEQALAATAAGEQRLGVSETRWRTSYDLLLEKYHALKLVGAVEPPKPVERAPTDPVTRAVNDACAGKPMATKLRNEMLKHVAVDRRNGISDEDILTAIQTGVPSNGIPA